jgi:hypothetical protein
MRSEQAATWWVNIHIAGNYDDARRICREFCMEVGECVTVTPTTYIYTGGEEAGVLVRFINYPRFPREAPQIMATAAELAERLMFGLSQHSYTLENPTGTQWVSRRVDK